MIPDLPLWPPKGIFFIWLNCSKIRLFMEQNLQEEGQLSGGDIEEGSFNNISNYGLCHLLSIKPSSIHSALKVQEKCNFEEVMTSIRSELFLFEKESQSSLSYTMYIHMYVRAAVHTFKKSLFNFSTLLCQLPTITT